MKTLDIGEKTLAHGYIDVEGGKEDAEFGKYEEGY